MSEPPIAPRQPGAPTGPLSQQRASTGSLVANDPPAAAAPPAAPAGDSRVAAPGTTPAPDPVRAAVVGTTPASATDFSRALAGVRQRVATGSLAPAPAAPAADPGQRGQEAARWLRENSESLSRLRAGNAFAPELAQVAGVLRRPEQLQQAREAIAPIAETPEGRVAMADLDKLQGAATGQRAQTEQRIQERLPRITRNPQTLAGIRSDQGRQDLEAVAAGNPASQAAFRDLAGRPPMAGEFPAGKLAVTDPARIGVQDHAMAADPRQAPQREAMVRQAVQGIADQHFGSLASGGAGNTQDAHARFEAGVQKLREAGVDGATIDRARQAVLNDPANQTMLRNPGLNAGERLLLDTGGAAAALTGVEGFLDRTVGTRDPNRPSDGIGQLSQITDRIPPGESRTLALEGEARFGAVQLGAGAEMTIARTQPQGTPPSTKLQVTFTVGAHAAVGFQKEFGKETAVGSVTGQIEAQARVDGKASFTYEFDTANPQHMAQLRDISGAVARAVPGVGGLLGGTEGPGVEQAFRGLSERHVETRYEGQVTATVRLEAKASTSDRSQQLVARFEQARAGLAQAQALTGSMQEAYGALGKSPPDFQAAFGAMQSHLPAGAQQASQVALDAQKAQALYAEGKTGEALQIMRGYLPQGLQNASQVATDASRAYQALSGGNAAEAFQIMQAHLPPGAQRAGQVAIDAQKAQALQAEGKTDEAMQLLRGYLPEGLQNASQVALDAYRAQQMIGQGDAAGAFNLMQAHLPPGAQRAGQVAQDAQRAQALIGEGKHAEALALLTPYIPAGVAGTVGQAQAGLASVNAVREAFDRGDLAGGLAAMQGAVAAGKGLAGALRQEVADLPGQIQSARAAIQAVKDMPAQLRDQIQALPGQARQQVEGLLTQAREQVQGLRDQAQALRDQAQALPATARAQAQALRTQAQGLTDRAKDQAKTLTEQARALPEQVRQGVMDRINAATAAPAGGAAPVGSVQLTGSLSARIGQTTNYRDNTSTTTFGLSAEGTVAAESSLAGQVGASGARSADIAITRGADGQITGVTIARSFEGSRFAATAGRELVGELDPQAIARIEATDKVSVVQQVDMNALGITRDMPSAEVARRLATLAMRADPPAGTGRVVRATATHTDSVTARADIAVASIAVRLDRTVERGLQTY
ncbi:MAG: hypothetical protein JWM80_596 [Cyanobacteria bacterium RYN_339]|nr:hypothetical protein [Cyanobacteria bacterium RYN_339]